MLQFPVTDKLKSETQELRTEFFPSCFPEFQILIHARQVKLWTFRVEGVGSTHGQNLGQRVGLSG